MKPHDDRYLLFGILALFIGASGYRIFLNLNGMEAILLSVTLASVISIIFLVLWEHFSKSARERKRRKQHVAELPRELVTASDKAVKMGREQDLMLPIYLPDSLRSRHVHILGATGSGKTESVILNFLRQDVARGLGSIILDAKGDAAFLASLNEWVPQEKLKVFDLSSENSLAYDPLSIGSPLEAAQRLFSSLTWSEEYYKSKAFSALQRMFQNHFRHKHRNPTLADLAYYLKDHKTYGAFVESEAQSEKISEREFSDISGLRDQIQTLCVGHLEAILSPKQGTQVQLSDAAEGCVLYFRLQSLLSPQLVSIVGKLLINHINFLAGTAHRTERATIRAKLIPTYLDEFASFACPEFADLISKARSAGYALHFSHQSIGDLAEVSKGFLNQITDNSATKIVLRINDPDSAEFFARSFGTKLYQKVTQRITNVKEIDLAEVVGEGTQREAHQFRASPDLFKTLPTGVGSVLIAHGQDTPHGGSSVFKIKFPELQRKENQK